MHTDTTPRSKFPRPSIPIILPLVAVAWLAASFQARADSFTDYTLNFSASSGSPTPTGSFVYDETTNSLTSYTINWDGGMVDFSNVLDAELSQNIISLADLLKSGMWCATSVPSGSTCPNFGPSVGSNIPFFDSEVGSEGAFGFFDSASLLTANSTAYGTFTVTPATPAVPEPSALALLGTALAGLFLFKFRGDRRGRQLRPHQPETA